MTMNKSSDKKAPHLTKEGWTRFAAGVVLSCLVLLFACLPVLSQTATATLSGVVEDEKGAVIAGCKITITNPATGLERTVVTNESGTFTIPLLPPATYT